MLPVLASFDIGGVSVSIAAYGTFLVLATIAALALAVRGARSLGVSRSSALAGFGVAVLAGLAGARILDVVLNLPYYAVDPGRVLAPEPRGFVLYGGLVGGLVAVTLVARAWHVSFASLADRSIPAVVAGVVLLRIGCFLNGCCAGTETGLPWGVVFPPRDSAVDLQVLGALGIVGQDGAVAVHPTQLYEIAAVLACGGLAWLVGRRGAAPGIPVLAFAASFLAFRAADQVLRAPSPGSSIPPELLPALYAVVAATAAGLLASRLLDARRDAMDRVPTVPQEVAGPGAGRRLSGLPPTS